MDSNHFAPPMADLERGLVKRKAVSPPRPIAIWIFYLFLGFFAAAFVYGLNVQLVGALKQGVDQISWSRFAFGSVFSLLILTLALALSIAIFRRWRAGRWIGATLIILFLGIALWVPDTTQYGSDAERAGGHFGRYAVFPATILWWAYAFGFSRKARRYFAKDDAST